MLQVSIIIPAKNEAANIGNCLDSIFAIDYPRDNYEVILVDNGSSDQTIQIARKKGAQVFVLPDAKISALRNYGSKQAKGQILVFMDADCTVAHNWLQQAEKYFNDENIACFGSAPQIPEQPTWVQQTWYKVRQKTEEITEATWLESMNMFVRHSIFERIGGFNETLITCEDVDLSYRLSKHGKIISDQNIKAIHHGEAATLAEFFRKERWRGKSNYQGLKEHGLRMAEIPSLILPPYFLLMAMIFLFFVFSRHWSYALYTFAFWQTPLTAITIIKTYKASSLAYFPKLFFLYNIYYMARSIAVF